MLKDSAAQGLRRKGFVLRNYGDGGPVTSQKDEAGFSDHLMNADTNPDLLDDLVAYTNHLLMNCVGAESTGPLFFVISKLAQSDPACKARLLEIAATTLADPELGNLRAGVMSRELIEFLAHVFRWPELLAFAELRVRSRFHGDWGLAAGDASSGVREAMRDAWEDWDLYQKFEFAPDAPCRKLGIR